MTATLTAFHGKPAVKRKYLARVEAHRKADELVQGTGWESNGETRGCAVGCIFNAYDHTRGPDEIGWPEELVGLVDAIHEGLPRKEAIGDGPKTCWPRRALAAAKPGADLSLVTAQFAVWCLTDSKWGATAMPNQEAEAIACCQRVATLWQRVIDGASLASLRDEFLKEEARAWAGAWAWAWAWAGAGAGAWAWEGAGAWAWAGAGFWKAAAAKLIELLETAPVR